MDNYETGIYTDNPDDTLRYMKSAEVVEVVRCKYCEHWKRQVGETGDDYFCAFGQNKSYREDFFCADGERRRE